MEGTPPILIKAAYDKPVVKIILHGEAAPLTLASPLILGTRHGCSMPSLLFNTEPEAMPRAVR